MTKDDNIDYDRLASKVAEEMDTGRIGETDRFMLSRRQLAAVAGSGIGAGALASLGIGSVEGQTAAGTIGTSSSPVNVEAQTVTTQDIDIGQNASRVSKISTLGPFTDVFSSNNFTLQDDSKEKIADLSSTRPAFIIAYNDTNLQSCLAFAAGGLVSIEAENPNTWSGSDTDGDNCIFRDNNNDLVIKNRTGGSADYVITAFVITA
jgi:hypothetical protein